MKRFVVIGTSCAGKTTFAKRAEKAFGLKHVELDGLFWKKDWVESERDDFRARVNDALASESWIVDGDYRSKVKDIVWPKADTIIWLDPGLPTILTRFFHRSLARTFTKQELWNGCRENLRNSIFSRNSLFLFILKTHKSKRRDYTKLVSEPPPGTRVVRLRNSREIDAFFAAT